MKIRKQLTVFLENQPGMMARVCDVMKEIDANILAFNLFGTVDHGVMRMIVDRPLDAIHALGNKGILVIGTDVLEIMAENRPGVLDEIARTLSKAKINIEYGYGSTGTGGGDRFFIQVSNSRKALLVLKNRDLKRKKKSPARRKTARTSGTRKKK